MLARLPIDRWRYTGFESGELIDPDGGGTALASPSRIWLSWVGALAPVLFAAIAYMVVRPPSVDLAAQLFRCELFAAHGFLAWNNYWYGGHYLLGYSVLFPPLGAAVGASVVGGLAAVGATGLFALLARRHYRSGVQLATLWFGAGTIAMVLSGRLTFVLGVAIGMAALVALDRERRSLALPLAAATSFASPVAGFFLLLVGGALALVGERRKGVALAAFAAAPIAVMAFAFPTTGPEPFVLSSLAGTLAVTLAVIVFLPREERLLRRGAMLYAGAVVLAYAIPNTLGGNVVRLSNLAAGPVLALGLAGRRRRLLLALLAIPLLYWQWQGAIRDVSRASTDPSVERSFYTPLLAELKVRTAGSPVRIEIPPTQDRWEGYYVAPHFPLARGWERQLESDELHLFRDRLSPPTYRAWLRANGVSYVALPRGVSLDYLAYREAALIRAGLPYLRPVWSNADWRLFAVRGATGLVAPPATLTAMGVDWFDLRTPHPARYMLRIHFSSYWTLEGAPTCLRPKGRWTLVEARAAGSVHVGTDLSAGALLGKHRICSDE
jgi:hypothetical protein